jgi:hypothetical protein
MKGRPAGAGLLMSKPTWFDTFWVMNRVGFFFGAKVSRNN